VVLTQRFESTRAYSVLQSTKEDIVQTMQEGQTIKHEVYGLGIVTASDQERTAVDFDDHGPKLFVTSIMTAELIGQKGCRGDGCSGGRSGVVFRAPAPFKFKDCKFTPLANRRRGEFVSGSIIRV
jgi:hypothetical protein